MDFKKILFFGLLFLTVRKMSASNSNSQTFGSVNGNNAVRKCDPYGCGHFGASRTDHKHNGIDLVVSEGQQMKSPFDCKVVRHGYPYADDLSYRLIEIEGTNGFEKYKAKLMYVKNLKAVGTLLMKGEAVCEAANIAAKYGASMTNHVHFELYENGKLIDPTPFFS